MHKTGHVNDRLRRNMGEDYRAESRKEPHTHAHAHACKHTHTRTHAHMHKQKGSLHDR